MAPAKPAPAPELVAVTLRSSARPGLTQCGEYKPDRVYTVPVAEAQRLVECKGFEYVTPGDKFVATIKQEG